MLRNLNHANKTIITIYGELKFDENGITNDLDKFQAEKMAKLKGYELVEETFQDKPEKEEEKPKGISKPVKEKPKKKPVKKKDKYSKNQLNNMTVTEIEKVAKKELGIELEDGVKKDKIKQVLEAQKQEG